MSLVVHGCEKLLGEYQVWWSKHMDKSGKVEGYANNINEQNEPLLKQYFNF